MAQFGKTFIQDLNQDIKIRQCGTIVFNADNLSNVINVELYNGTTPATLGGTVVCSVICSDGSTVPVENGTISGNTVTVTLTGACFAIGGQIGVGIQIVDGDVKTTVFKGIYNVERLTTENVIDPDSRITLQVADLIDDIETAIASIPSSYTDLMAAVAPTFDTSTAYSTGAYVWYDGKLYRFTTDHAAGSWNAAQVELAVVTNAIPTVDDTLSVQGAAADAKKTGDEFSNLRSQTDAIENLEPSTVTGALAPFVQGSVSQQNGTIDHTSNTQCCIGPISMKTGDTVAFTRSVNKITTSLFYAIYDKNGNFVKGSSMGTGNTLTFDQDGMFAIGCPLNSAVSATMEEAIAAANTSFTVSLTQTSPLLDKVDDLENRVEALEDVDISGIVSELEELEQEVSDIETLTSRRKTVHFTFAAGSLGQYTGVIDRTSTTACCTDKIPAFAGDTFTFSRTVNKIPLTFVYAIYDKNGNYVSGTSSGQGTITMANDGMFAIGTGPNSSVSATLEEAISAAHDSFTGNITDKTVLAETIEEYDTRLDNIEDTLGNIGELVSLAGTLIVEKGLHLTAADMLTGKYYSVSNNTAALANDTTARYTDLIDVSALRGKQLIVHLGSIRTGSSRAFGFCDSEMNVSSYSNESSCQPMADGTYRKILLVTEDYLFFSCSGDVTSIDIEIPAEYLFPTKKGVDFALNTKRYYHMSFDDVYLCLQDITENEETYQSIFENDFLGWCKEMHDKYGTTFSMYVFYQNAASNPTWALTDCTNAFAAEFTANADWLKFGFHAHDSSGTATSRESTAAEDYAAAIAELVRITGSVECIDRVPRLHEYNGTLTALSAIRDCELGCVGFIASADTNLTTPRDSYYFDADENAYMYKHAYMYDAENHLHFVKTSYLWGGANDVSVADRENSILYYDRNKYVEIFMHENQMDSSGYRSSLEGRFNQLSYTHLPYYMMNLVMTN